MDTQPQAARTIPDNLHITRIEGQNFKIIPLCDVRLDDKGHLIPISGPNSAGKSSLIDLAQFTLLGKSAMPSKPIREGETEMMGRVTLGNGQETAVTVTRKMTKKGDRMTDSLKVVTAAGEEVLRPQEFLNGSVGNLAFDPLAFAYLKPAEQTVQLLDVLGLTGELDKVEAEIKTNEQERVIAGRERDQVKGQITGLKAPTADTPTEPVDTQAVLAEISKAQDIQTQRSSLVSDSDARMTGVSRDLAEISNLEAKIAELKQRVEENQKAGKAAQKQLQELPTPDIDALRNKLANAEHVNNAVRDAETYRALTGKLQEKTKAWEEYDNQIKKLRNSTTDLLKNADLGVEGLEIKDRVIHLNGIPLDQASTSQQLVVGVKIGMLANPTIRAIFIRDGSLLDSNTLKLIGDMAKGNDYEILYEKVDETGEVGFVMEHGLVVHEPAAVTG